MKKIENGMKFSAIFDSINEMMDYIVPVGVMLPYAGKTAPEGWLMCDGSTYYSNDYPALGKLLGASGGSFTLPDVNGKYLKGSNGGVVQGGASPSVRTIKPTQSSYAVEVNTWDITGTDLPYVGMNFIIKY